MEEVKNDILNHTDKGLEIFKHYIPDIRKHGTKKKFMSVFRDDGENPSANVFLNKKGDSWLYKDFVNGEALNPVDFVMKLCKCDFKQALNTIKTEIINCSGLPYKHEPIRQPDIKRYKLDFNDDFSYWLDYGEESLMIETLRKYDVLSLLAYTIITTNQERVTKATKDDPIFAFKISDNCYKIYRPHAKSKNAKHLWLGEKPEKYRNLYGLEQLPENNEYILIVEGLKDTIVAISNGITAVGVDNASTKLHEDDIALMRKKCKNLIICYDIDSVGLETSEKASSLNGLRRLILPDSLHVEGGKDISDFFKLKHTSAEINTMVNNIVQSALETEVNDNKVINKIEEIVFYIPSFDKDGNLKDVKIDYIKWIEVLYGLGFRRFDIDKNFVFVRIQNQIIDEVSVTQIQDVFINFLENLPEELSGDVSRDFLIGKFYRSPSHYFCDNRLNLLKPKEPFVFITDTKEECFLYFKNGFVHCTGAGYQLLQYEHLKGLIWKNQLVDHEFSVLNLTLQNPLEIGEFSKFIFNVCGKDINRYESLTSIIGYMLHSDCSGKLKGVLLTDSKISDVANGRTGKTLLGQSFKHIKEYTEINGKDFDPANKHKYQEANLDTQIVHLNDVKKNFDIECVFNDITEEIVVDKKNIKPFKIKIKFMISSNKIIIIEGASAKDRVIEFEFSDYYSDVFSPEDEFQHRFFRDWDESEWMNFYNFFINCICTYLKKGIIKASQINLNKRKLLGITSNEFVDFMDDQVKSGEIKPGIEYNKKELFDRFLIDSPDYAENKRFNQRKFTEYLRAYAEYSVHFSRINPEIQERKSGNIRYIIFPPP